MRSRKSANEHVAEVARRRLELLGAELAELRSHPVDPPVPRAPDGGGEPAVQDVPPQARATSTARQPVPDPGPGRHAHRSVGWAASVGGWTHDRLPPTLQGRVGLTAAHLAVLGLLVAGALGVTAWWVVRAGGAETTLPPVSSTPSALAPISSPSGAPSGGPSGAPSGTPSSATGTASSAAAPTGSIVVDVAGKVRRPGIATLPLGSRVVDALESAGGPRPGVRLGTLNLARVLSDGEQILVGAAVPPGIAASAVSAPTSGSTAGADGSTPMVSLNSASQAELEELPDIGPVTAQSILTFRTENGAFTAVDELLEVSGIGDVTLAKIAPFVTL